MSQDVVAISLFCFLGVFLHITERCSILICYSKLAYLSENFYLVKKLLLFAIMTQWHTVNT